MLEFYFKIAFKQCQITVNSESIHRSNLQSLDSTHGMVLFWNHLGKFK